MTEQQQEMMLNLVFRHFVSLRGIDRTPGKTASAFGGLGMPFRASASVACIRSEWFLITAGHVIKRIIDAVEAGRVFGDWALDVGGRPDAQSIPFIPFDFVAATKHYMDEDFKGDFGFIHLHPEYREKLSSYGVVPFTDATWRCPDEMSFYWLLGIPEEMVELRGEGESVEERTWHTVIGVERLAVPPDGIKEGAFFYGLLPARSELVQDGNELDDITGVSGGPILGWKTLQNRLVYCPVAIQSAWYKTRRIIIGYPFGAYAEWIGQSLDSDLISL